MELQIALVQMEIIEGEKNINLTHVLNILKELRNSEKNIDIVVFPELFTTGFSLEHVERDAEPILGNTIQKIIEISKGQFMVIGSILEADDGYYNTAFIIGKEGKVIGTYRKIHLFGPMKEKEYLKAGNAIKTFKCTGLEDIRLGLAICYDLRFPELFRVLALKGAQIVIVPSEFPNPKVDVWKTLLTTRAIENQFYIIGVNRVGIGANNSFFGNSLISNGNETVILGTQPTVKIFKIDLSTIDNIRDTLPLLKDRREDLYKFENI
ncbi:MAG: carbon-nitrogen family hydrolase [Candidatus Lokiarchaeota archaeon]|nr:carbon-nitrogen family hydrolase [Candidatus Lokiarchaeota archaeon]